MVRWILELGSNTMIVHFEVRQKNMRSITKFESLALSE